MALQNFLTGIEAIINSGTTDFLKIQQAAKSGNPTPASTVNTHASVLTGITTNQKWMLGILVGFLAILTILLVRRS